MIGISMRCNDGEEAPHGKLDFMMMSGETEDLGLITYVEERDPASGVRDRALRDTQGNPYLLFLSFGNHDFRSPATAHSAVIALCQKLYEVSAYHCLRVLSSDVHLNFVCACFTRL